LLFINKGESTPLSQKAIPEIEKLKGRHNTQKIIYFYRVMLKRRRRLKKYIRRENHPLLYIFILI